MKERCCEIFRWRKIWNARWYAREIFCFAESEIKSTHRRNDITRRRRISDSTAVFPPPARVDYTEKEHLRKASALFPGGEGGIRTRETLLTPTRFPVVRLRPAQPPLHFCAGIRSLKSACISYSIFRQKSSLFWDFFANARESLDYPLTLWVKYDIILLTYRDDGKFFRRHLTIPTPARPETP